MAIWGRKYVTFIDSSSGYKEKVLLSDLERTYGSEGTVAHLLKSGKVILEDVEAMDEYSCSYRIKEFTWEEYCEWVQVNFMGRDMDGKWENGN